jgi:hypothetical protein
VTPGSISAERMRALEDSFAAQWGTAPNAAQRKALGEQAAQEEMLYREARVLQLDLDDGSVRRRLLDKMHAVGVGGRNEDELVRRAIGLGFDDDAVIRRLLSEKMRLVLERPSTEPIGDAELVAYLEQHAAEFRKPATVSLTQVFLAEEAHGAALAADAARTLQTLRAEDVSAERIAALSDPAPIDSRLRAYTLLQLQGRFGKSFAERVFALEPGSWSEPIASPYGLHLVRLDERREERLPELSEVRSALRGALEKEHARENLARGLARLSSLYEIRIEDPAPAGVGAIALQAAR